MEPKGSLPRSKDLATWPYSVSDEFIPHPSFVCKIHLVVFFLCLGPRSFKPHCFLVCRSLTCIPDSHIYRVIYTRWCIDTIDSPDDEHWVARNMQRSEIHTL